MEEGLGSKEPLGRSPSGPGDAGHQVQKNKRVARQGIITRFHIQTNLVSPHGAICLDPYSAYEEMATVEIRKETIPEFM